MTKYCAFCSAEAEYMIDGTNTPICSHCQDTYEAGQASPDATFTVIEE